MYPKVYQALELVSPVEDIESQSINFDCTFDGGDGSQDDASSNEIIKTIQHLTIEIDDLQDDKELTQLLNDIEPTNYEDTEKLCQMYNNKMLTLKQKWRTSGRRPTYFRRRATGPFLRHILRQCYERAVDNPAVLNSYPPFSSAVYGETSFELVETLLDAVCMRKDDVFIDLGSGVGQVVLQVAASTEAKMCRGIEKADYPALCANRMSVEFEHLMKFYGKPFQPFELEKSDFLLKENRDKILQSSVVFVNNYAFGPDVDHQLMECFKHLNQDSKIISSKAYRPRNFRITDRNLCDLASILRTEELPPKKVSWTATTLSYTVHTVDRSLLEEYFANTKVRNGRPVDGQENHRIGCNVPKMCRSASANALDKSNKKVTPSHNKKPAPKSECVTPISVTPITRLRHGTGLLFRSPVDFPDSGATCNSKYISGSHYGKKGGRTRVTRLMDQRGRPNKKSNRLHSNRSAKPTRFQEQRSLVSSPESKNILGTSEIGPKQVSGNESPPNSLNTELFPKDTSTPSRMRRPALSLAQAALQRYHQRHSPPKAPQKSGDEMVVANTNEINAHSSPSVPAMYSTPRPLRRSRHDYGSVSESSTPSTVTKSSTPTGPDQRSQKQKSSKIYVESQRKHLTRRAGSTGGGAMSSPALQSTATVKGGGISSIVREYPVYHNEYDYIQRHNLSILHEDMLVTLDCPLKEDKNETPFSGPCDPHTNQSSHKEVNPLNLHGLDSVRKQLTQHQSTHPGYLHERQCLPLAIQQFMVLCQQQLMDWYKQAQVLANTPAPLSKTSQETGAPAHQESLLVLELRKQLHLELRRRNELRALVRENANEVAVLSNQTIERLSEVLEKMSIHDVRSISDMVRQAKVILHHNQELAEKVRQVHAEVRQEKAMHRKLRTQFKQLGGQHVLQRLRSKLTKKAAENCAANAVAPLPPPATVAPSLSTTILPIKKARNRIPFPFPPPPPPPPLPLPVASLPSTPCNVDTNPFLNPPVSNSIMSNNSTIAVNSVFIPLAIPTHQQSTPSIIMPAEILIPPPLSQNDPLPEPSCHMAAIYPTTECNLVSSEAPLRPPYNPVYSPISGSESIPYLSTPELTVAMTTVKSSPPPKLRRIEDSSNILPVTVTHPIPHYVVTSPSKNKPAGIMSSVVEDVPIFTNSYARSSVANYDTAPYAANVSPSIKPPTSDAKSDIRVQLWLDRCVSSLDTHPTSYSAYKGAQQVSCENLRKASNGLIPHHISTKDNNDDTGIILQNEQQQQLIYELYKNCLSHEHSSHTSHPFLVNNSVPAVSLSSGSHWSTQVPSSSVLPTTHLPPRERWRSTHTAWRHSSTSSNTNQET